MIEDIYMNKVSRQRYLKMLDGLDKRQKRIYRWCVPIFKKNTLSTAFNSDIIKKKGYPDLKKLNLYQTRNYFYSDKKRDRI